MTSKDVGLVKDPTHANVNKLAFEYSDGIIFNGKEVEEELRKYAEQSGKPVLEYSNQEEYIDSYSEFFDKIIENKK